jgi:hypothetical protein
MARKTNKDKRTELLVLREKYKQQFIHRSQHTTQEIVSMVKTAGMATGGVWAGFKLLRLITGKGRKTEKIIVREGAKNSAKNKSFINEIGTAVFGSLFYEVKTFVSALLRQMILDFLHEKMQHLNKKKSEND